MNSMASNQNSGSEEGTVQRIGVLLTNLGTPDAPTPKALRRYLKEFLSDPRIVQIPRFIWWIILHLLILPFRPKKSAKLYASIWTEHGSPLLVHTQQTAIKLFQILKPQWGQRLELDYAMRYGSDSISEKIEAMINKGVTHLLIIPLYPQFSETTTASTLDKVLQSIGSNLSKPKIKFVDQYHDFQAYIQACAEQIKLHCRPPDNHHKLIFSYHGLPQSFVDKGDPYYDQCLKTSALIAAELNLQEGDLITTFQSRFGKAEWLKPYTEQTLKSLPEQGVKSVDIFCPGFSADCLETLEEIAHENKHYFLEHGGESYNYIPALNSTPHHIKALQELIQKNLQEWNSENK